MLNRSKSLSPEARRLSRWFCERLGERDFRVAEARGSVFCVGGKEKRFACRDGFMRLTSSRFRLYHTAQRRLLLFRCADPIMLIWS